MRAKRPPTPAEQARNRQRRRELLSLIDITIEQSKVRDHASLLNRLTVEVRDDRYLRKLVWPMKPRQAVLEALASHARRQVRIDSLDDRRRLFVLALCGPCTGNATRAAMMAGYSPNNYGAAAVTAHRLLKKADIYEALTQTRARKRAVSDWAYNRIVELASSSYANFISVDVDGNWRFDMKRAEALGALGQVRHYEENVLTRHRNGKPKLVQITLRLHDPLPYLRLLLQMHGLLKPRVGGQAGGDDVFFETVPVSRAG